MLEVTDLCKDYAGVPVLSGINFKLSPGERATLVGENGAGKSTLVRCLSGAVTPTAGNILLNGQPVRLPSPLAARRLGIALVPQELAYVPTLTVAQNLFLGRWPRKGPILLRRTTAAQAAAILEGWGLPISPAMPMSELSLPERQLIEIAKVVLTKLPVLLLDEPTASLTSDEADRLYKALAALTSAGTATISITHRLDEVPKLGDRVLVLRNGTLVCDAPTRDMTPAAILESMLGTVPAHTARTTHGPSLPEDAEGPFRMRLDAADTSPPLSNIVLTARPGIVVGVFGLLGSGLYETAYLLSGRSQIRACHGSVAMGQTEYTLPLQMKNRARLRLAFLPPERKRDGLVLSLSVSRNIALPSLRSYTAQKWLLRRKHMAATARDEIRKYDMRSASPNVLTHRLSGGTQQKVLFSSRALYRPSILVLCEPTRGVDVGVRYEIHRAVVSLAESGRTVIVFSSDAEELADVSDEVMVLRDGKQAGLLASHDLSVRNLLAIATGAVP